MIFLVISICVFAGFYSLSRKDGQNKFASIFHGCWWAIIWLPWLILTILLKILVPNISLNK
jgi:hypothetical protein